jgi:hypothetical protein
VAIGQKRKKCSFLKKRTKKLLPVWLSALGAVGGGKRHGPSSQAPIGSIRSFWFFFARKNNSCFAQKNMAA